MHLSRHLAPCLAAIYGLAVYAEAGGGCSPALPPSRDPWYTLPEGADCTSSPGKVLRLRRAPKRARDSLRGIQDVWNVLFCSTDSLGAPAFSVTTVIIPRDADTHVLLTYPPAYDSPSIDSSPSYAMNDLEDAVIEQAIFTPLLVSKRWVVNMPDFEGPRGAYLAGNNSGHGVLDSIRAVDSLCRHFGLAKDFKQTVYGYSGGAFAAQWAAQLQPSYAPELKIDAMAYGGLAVNATGALGTVNSSPHAGLIVSVFLGVTAQFPDARQILVDCLHKTGPYNATTFFSAADQSVADTLAAFNNQDITRYFTNGFDFLQNPVFARAFRGDTTAGFGDTPTIPLYAFHAIADEVSPSHDMDHLVEKYCAAGASIEYRRNTVGDHTSTGIVEGIRALNWLSSLFQSKHQPIRGCATHNVSSPLGIESLALMLIVFGKQGYNIPYFLQQHPLPGVPTMPANATNPDVFRALELTTRDALDKIDLNDQALAEFHISGGDLAELGIQ